MSVVRNSVQTEEVIIGRDEITAQQVVDIAKRRSHPVLDGTSSYRAWIDKGASVLVDLLQRDGVIYGVTTGYGDSVTTEVSLGLAYELPRQIYTFHGCGLGNYLSEEETRAVLTCRLISLARGYSGVSWELLKQLEAFLHHDILPLIPEEGSVGASGDLTPLSYVAACLCGEREVRYRGEQMAASKALELAGLKPITLKPKEGLAMMNGTAVMTAIALLNLDRAQYMMKLATRITAMMVIAVDGNEFHFDERLFATKPFPGMSAVARQLREELNVGAAPEHCSRLQDRYSTRCAPHVLGVLADALPHYCNTLEIELNSTNDNPVIDPDTHSVLHGGHFYGGHVAHVMDSMKVDIANICDLLDRQLAQIVDVKFNHGLPSNLSGATGPRAAINHGLKAVQIGVSSWTAEAMKNTMPASVFSRSTECHNQDKVSMGTIASRDCRRSLDICEQVIAATLFAGCQGVMLRTGGVGLSETITATLQQVFNHVDPLENDRRLDNDLRELMSLVRTQRVNQL